MADAVRKKSPTWPSRHLSTDLSLAEQIEPLEEVVDNLCDTMKLNHVSRLQKKVCTIAQGFIFSDIITGCGAFPTTARISRSPSSLPATTAMTCTNTCPSCTRTAVPLTSTTSISSARNTSSNWLLIKVLLHYDRPFRFFRLRGLIGPVDESHSTIIQDSCLRILPAGCCTVSCIFCIRLTNALIVIRPASPFEHSGLVTFY